MRGAETWDSVWGIFARAAGAILGRSAARRGRGAGLSLRAVALAQRSLVHSGGGCRRATWRRRPGPRRWVSRLPFMLFSGAVGTNQVPAGAAYRRRCAVHNRSCRLCFGGGAPLPCFFCILRTGCVAGFARRSRSVRLHGCRGVFRKPLGPVHRRALRCN